MSSTIEIQKICEHCGKQFIARKSTTRFCSHQCSNRAYKKEKRELHVKTENEKVSVSILQKEISGLEFLNPTKCAQILGVSRRTLYRYLESGKIPCVQFQKKTLISRAVLDKMFENPSVYIKKEKTAETAITEFYSTKEILEKFNIGNTWLFKIAKEKNIPKSVVRGKTFWSKAHIDKIFKDKVKENFDMSEWYTADEICEKFQMTKDAVYRLAYENIVRKMKDKKSVLYSKYDIDKILKAENCESEFYTMAEAMERFNMTRDQISHYVRTYKVTRKYDGKFVKIKRKELDSVLAGPIIVKKR